MCCSKGECCTTVLKFETLQIMDVQILGTFSSCRLSVVRWRLIYFSTNTAVYCLRTKMRIISNVANRKRQITVRLAGYSRILGPQCGICFMSPVWRLEFGSGSAFFFGGGGICGPLVEKAFVYFVSNSWN
jgi:hypothetical protein